MTESVPTTRRWRRGALFAIVGALGADHAALNYVDSHHPGPGTADVLKTEPDVDRGVPIYDVRVVAPNGTTDVVHVQQSNDALLFANPAEQQLTPPPTTATAPLRRAPRRRARHPLWSRYRPPNRSTRPRPRRRQGQRPARPATHRPIRHLDRGVLTGLHQGNNERQGQPKGGVFDAHT